MSVIDIAVGLPKLAFLTAWDMIDLGEPHPVLGSNRHHWMPDDTQRELHTATLAMLAEHGLARRDRLNPLFSDTLRVIAGADCEFYAWSQFTADAAAGAVLVAVREQDAIRIAVSKDNVVLQPIRAKWPATSLLDALPDVDGARVRTVHVPQKVFDDPHTRPADPLAAPPDSRDVDYINDLLRASRDAVHQLYTATRTSDGDRVRSLPITAIDLTGRGRILSYRTSDDNIALTPGTPRDVIKTLNDTLSGLRAC